MEETQAALGIANGNSDDFNKGPGKDIFWSNLNENYAMVITVDTIDVDKSPPRHGTVPDSAHATVENELKQALEMISQLEKEKSSLQNHVFQLENALSSGLRFYILFWID